MTMNTQNQDTTQITLANESYNEMVYPSKPFSFTSIASLETAGVFYGLNPVPIKQAKVLELGSSFGGNIISQALYYPDAQFIGVDLSHEQIKIGNEIIKSIGLNNIRLEEKNILDIDQNFGEFDYIIVHGIYSWVPDIVKNKILAICRDNLSENGIAYISYNTYPGWKTREVVREMMLFTNKYYQNLPLIEQTQRSKIVTNLFLDTFKATDVHFKGFDHIIKAMEDIQGHDDYYLAHEYLETFNDPCYLHEFVDRAENQGLHYIGDCGLALSFASCLNTEHRQLVTQLSENNYVVKEQCIDYLRNTAFRRSLLCHQKQGPMVNHSENIPTVILDRLSFIKDHSFSIDEIHNETLKEVFSSEYIVTIQKIKEAALRRQDDSLNEMTIYSSILTLLLLGKINAYLTPYKTYKFEENKSYIPEQFIRYLKTLLLDGATNYISYGDMYNRNFGGINQIHLPAAEALRTPKTKAELETILQTYLDETNQTITKGDIHSLVDSVLETFALLGYLQPVEDEVK